MTAERDWDFWAEVSRKAWELADRHGWNAHLYAARLAAEALAEGETDESKFWKAVEATLTPRIESK